MTSTDHSAAAARRSAAEQERTELRAALHEERRGYVQRGLDHRVAGVDAQLRALGDERGPATTTPSAPPAPPAPAGNPPVKAKADEAAKPAAPAVDPQAATTPATPAPTDPKGDGDKPANPAADPQATTPAAPATEKKATPARGAKVTSA